MDNQYIHLIEQTFDFPTEDFKVVDDELYFHGIPLMEVVRKFGTPIRITYLPKIGSQIKKTKKLFTEAMQNNDYNGNYIHCYCTKSSHFSFVMKEVLKNGSHIETSSSYDIPLVRKLFQQGLVKKDTFIVCNGFKMPLYIQYISDLINDGFINTIPVLDNMMELKQYKGLVHKKCKIGIRIAAEEEPNFEFYTSRLGVRYNDIVNYYLREIKGNPKFELKMLHFFINTGIRDSSYYWSELEKCVNVYCDLKKEAPELQYLDIGGGFPVKSSLGFDYDYTYMANEIVAQIKKICSRNEVPEPDIVTEFGTYTVGESGAILFSIIGEKIQNDRERWYMIDSSFLTTLPDTWGINQRFILLALNHWNKKYQHVNLGGLTCDSLDYYNAEAHVNQVFLPKVKPTEKLYIGFFNTGAYQESVGGYGGIQHCLTPAPKHLLIDINSKGKYTYRLFAKEQDEKSMLKILGY